MGEHFDSYWEWLGISPLDQPASVYRLLDLAEREADPAVIAAAADRRMTLVKQFAIGPRRLESQRMLNELSAARVLLLNPAAKADYDAKLVAKPRSGPPPLTRRSSTSNAEITIEEQPAAGNSTAIPARWFTSWRSASTGRRVAVTAILLAIACGGLLLRSSSRGALSEKHAPTIARPIEARARWPNRSRRGPMRLGPSR